MVRRTHAEIGKDAVAQELRQVTVEAAMTAAHAA